MSHNSNWLDKYLDLAKHISTWSKDPSKKIGCVAVGKHGQILSQGFNGFARGINDSLDKLNDRNTKYKYVVHAEQNCIYNATLNGVSLDNASLFVYGLPVCSECAKGVIQVGIKNVYMKYPKDIDETWKNSFELTSQMFDETGISYKISN